MNLLAAFRFVTHLSYSLFKLRLSDFKSFSPFPLATKFSTPPLFPKSIFYLISTMRRPKWKKFKEKEELAFEQRREEAIALAASKPPRSQPRSSRSSAVIAGAGNNAVASLSSTVGLSRTTNARDYLGISSKLSQDTDPTTPILGGENATLEAQSLRGNSAGPSQTESSVQTSSDRSDAPPSGEGEQSAPASPSNAGEQTRAPRQETGSRSTVDKDSEKVGK